MSTNLQKVTAEFCITHGTTGGGGLVFFPQHIPEAQDILSKLQSFGFRKEKKQGKESEIVFLQKCVDRGLLLISGTIQWNEFSGLRGVTRCRPEQLLDDNYMPPDERTLRELFAEVTTRQDAIEAKLNRVLELLEPKGLDKPGIFRK